MKAPFLARKAHKWLALIVGIQAMFWMVSGAYMATVDIDFIHGDPLVRNVVEPVNRDLPGLYPMGDILERYPQATQVQFVARRGHPHYVVKTAQGSTLLDATTGAERTPIDRSEAMLLAKHYYAGDGEIATAVLLDNDDARPTEIQSRPLPLWQVRFDDRIETTFYVSPTTGELITRRHTFWRLYDFLWMFHIMDYENRTDFNNNLLRVAAFVGLMFALTGVWLLFYSLKKRQQAVIPVDDSTISDSHDLVPKTP